MLCGLQVVVHCGLLWPTLGTDSAGATDLLNVLLPLPRLLSGCSYSQEGFFGGGMVIR